MKTHAVLLRLSQEEYAALHREALKLNTSKAALVRTYVNEALAGFDQGHEEIISVLRGLQAELRSTRKLAASALGGVCLLNSARYTSMHVAEVRANLDQAYGMAEAADQLFQQFQKRGG